MPRLQLLLFLLLGSCSYIQSQQTCQSFVDGLFAKFPVQLLDPNNLTDQEKYYVQFSGRQGFRDLGQRTLCEEQPSMAYYVLVMPGRDGPHNHDQEENGVCVIKECNMETLGTDTVRIKRLAQMNNWFFGDVTIVLYDINEDVPRDAAFYINWIYQAALVIGGIGSTVLLYIRSRKKGESQKKKSHWLVEAFDIRAALKNLYQTAKEQNQNENLATLGFYRIFASWWVVALHTKFYMIRMVQKWDPEYKEGFFTLSFGQGDYAVDFFFFMSGFLCVYVMTPKFQKEELTFKGILSHWKHRFIRIWPLCMMGIIFFALMIVFMFKGPMWGKYAEIVPFCKTVWWQKLLLIDNLLYKEGGNCLTITWYISVDLQSYVLVILVIFLYAKSRAGGYVCALLMILLSHLTSLDRMGMNQNQFLRYYLYTPARMGDIFIGAAFGMHYYDYAKLKMKINLYWLCSRFVLVKYAVMAAGYYLLYYFAYYVPETVDMEINESKNQANRARIVCVCAAILSVITVQHSHRCIVKMFYNLRIFQILGKLSYGLYLFHFPIIFAVLFTRDQEFPGFDSTEYIRIVFKIISITYCVCIIYWVFFERPLAAIEAHFMKRRPRVQIDTKANGNQVPDQAQIEINTAKVMNGEEIKLLPVSANGDLKDLNTTQDKIVPVEIISTSQTPIRELEQESTSRGDQQGKSRPESRLQQANDHITPIEVSSAIPLMNEIETNQKEKELP